MSEKTPVDREEELAYLDDAGKAVSLKYSKYRKVASDAQDDFEEAKKMRDEYAAIHEKIMVAITRLEKEIKESGQKEKQGSS